jgi:hypothetical protein
MLKVHIILHDIYIYKYIRRYLSALSVSKLLFETWFCQWLRSSYSFRIQHTFSLLTNLRLPYSLTSPTITTSFTTFTSSFLSFCDFSQKISLASLLLEGFWCLHSSSSESPKDIRGLASSKHDTVPLFSHFIRVRCSGSRGRQWSWQLYVVLQGLCALVASESG